jgi:integrase/recombinase XerD
VEILTMTPLRQRFIDDMRVRNYSPRTIECYIIRLADFARHFGRSPEQMGPEEVRAFQLEMLRRQYSWSTFNQTVCALRLLYGMTLGRPEQVPFIPFGKRPQTLPVVLSPEETLQFLEAAEPGRDRTLFQTTYACGLRLSEVTHLQIPDIDSKRMVLIVRQGKGAKDRLVPLSVRLLEVLRAYWRECRPRPWLFPGRGGRQPLTGGGVERRFRRTLTHAGLTKAATMHTLRHCFATHMLEAGVDLRTLQAMMGHTSLKTTMHYLQISSQCLRRAPSLLDRLMLPAPKPTEGQP